MESADERIARVTVQLDEGGEPRPAVAYPRLTGPVEAEDEVVVNAEAADLGLGSGGFDVVHCNLTRGLDGDGGPVGRSAGRVGRGETEQVAVAVVEDPVLRSREQRGEGQVR